MEAILCCYEQVSIDDDIRHYIYILIQIVSVRPHPTMKMYIHNQCSYFKLVKREYSNTNIKWNKEFDVEVDTGNMTSAFLTSSWVDFEGGLMYQLQRKHIKSDDQLELTCTLLLVIWKSEGYKKFRVLVLLMECDKTFCWYKIRPKEYCQKYVDRFSTYTGPIKNTWQTRDGTMLTTGLELDLMQRHDVLNITISDGIKDYHTEGSVWLDPKK
jgi:hypothetical protein